MPARTYKLQHVSIEGDGGLQISYYDPASDVKAAGVVKLRTLLIPAGFDYDDEIAAVTEALQYLINDVEEDWPNLTALREGDRDLTPMRP